MEIKQDVNLAEYTSWLVGGPADHFCAPTNEQELKEAWTWAQSKSLPVTVLGGGTNVLVSDRGVRGLTICQRRFSKLTSEIKDESLFIHCLAGTAKSELLKVFLKH